MEKKRLIYTLKDYFNDKYNDTVYKITLDAGFSCPNRDGTKSTGGCIYCDSNGSGNGMYKDGYTIEEQIKNNKIFLNKRYKVNKFYIYFQAFTNTHAEVDKLKKIYDRAIKFDQGDILGIIIGTRPDCIDKEKLDLISSYSSDYEVWIEYGLQTVHKKTLDYINRQHTVEDYLKAVELTKSYPLKMTTHMIVGLPYETHDQIMETAGFIIKNGQIDALKIHSFYIPRGSRLEEIYKNDPFPLMTLDENINTIVDIIEIVPENLILAPESDLVKKENINTALKPIKLAGMFRGRFLIF